MPFDRSLISVEQAREYLGVRGSGEDRLLGEIVKAATDLAEAITDRKLKTRTYALGGDEAAFVLNGNGQRALRLPQSPVTAISKVEFLTSDSPEVWEEQSLSTYPVTIDPDVPGRIVYRASAFPRGVLNVKVSATCGYVSIPENLTFAIRELVLSLYRQKDKQLAGVASRTFEGQTTTYDLDAVPKQVILLLEPFRRMECV